MVARPVTLYVRDVPDSLAAVHLPGHAPGAALRHPDSPVRHQRPDPAHARLQPPGGQPRLLLGAERLPRLHRPAGLVRQPLRPVRRHGAVPLAEPFPGGTPGLQPAAGVGRRDRDWPSGGTTGSNSTSRPASTSTSTTPATPRVVRDNAIDPLQNTQQITSSAELLQALQLGHADAWAATGARTSATAACSSCCRR